MTRTEIIVKAHIDNESVLFPENGQKPFKSIADAAAYMRSNFKDEPIEYVLEIEKDANGISRGYDRKEEFETAWRAIEEEKLTEEWHELPRRPDRGALPGYILGRIEGPIFTKDSVPVSRDHELIAAE